MICIYSNPNFAIFDQVLDKQSFDTLGSMIESAQYKRTNLEEWITVYKNLDGSPLESSRFSSENLNIQTKGIEDQSGLVGFSRALNQVCSDYSPIVGQRKKDWSHYTGRITLYSQGTKLSWHQDGPGRTGAYVYFAHREWNVQWGGELCLADSLANNDELSNESQEWNAIKQKNQHIDNSLQNRLLLKNGFGHYVQPKPNRLVIFNSKVHYMINRVDASAGNHFRVTVSGFFIKGEGGK